jgi:NAD(P)H-nitrite reductase large subunit
MTNTKKWKCVICEHIHEGDTPPKICPVCSADSKQFEEISNKPVSSSKDKIKILIIGSGASGYYAAKAIRQRNTVCDIEIVSQDKSIPYFRPMLSSYLGKDLSSDKLFISPNQWYNENNIKLTLETKVIRIDTDTKKAILENSNEISYDKLILATGSHAFIPPIPGKEKARAINLRTIENADKIKNYLKSAENAVIVGGGLLGLEAACEISKMGVKVTVIERNPILMHRQLDKTSANILKSMMEKNNVKILLGESVKEILGFTKVTGVKLSNNKSLRCDLAIFSVGIKSNINIAEKSNINYHKGILVNEKMETNVKDIYACGDCSEFNNKVYGNWTAAEKMGEVAGANAVGDDKHFENFIPSFLFEGFNTSIFSCGNLHSTESTQQVRLIDNERKIFKRLYFKHDIITGAILMGNIDKSKDIIHAIEFKKTFSDIIKEYTLM